jgi:hypothetical protein
MLKKLVAVTVLTLCIGLFSGCGNEKAPDKSTTGTSKNNIVTPGKVDITFNYVKQQGMGSNQFAVWIEDANGKYIKTLGVTKFVAVKGYKTREMALVNWVKTAKRPELTDKQVEAITTATPSTGEQKYEWDCTDAQGKPVLAGEYSYVVEATRYMEDYDLFSGKILVGAKTVTSKAALKKFGDAEKNKNMVTDVSAKFIPNNNL